MPQAVSTTWLSSIYGSFLLLLLLLPGSGPVAQTSSPRTSARDLTSLPGVKIRYLAPTGFCTFVQFDPLSLAGSSRYQRALNFLQEYGRAFGFAPPEHTLLYVRQDTDVTGGHHLLFRQRWYGLPTVGGELRFHFDRRDRLTAVSGLLLPAEPIDRTPGMPAGTATAKAKSYFAGDFPDAGNIETPEPTRLVLFRSGLLRGGRGRNHLAYAVSLTSESGEGAILYLDAHTGALLERHPTVHPVLDRRLYERSAAGNNLIWTEGDPIDENLLSGQQEILTVTAHFYQLLSATFDRNSYDGQGAQLRAVYNPTWLNCLSSANANWNGSTINLCPKVISDDVIAHEWGHALIQSTSNLIYAYQPGALNESFCDILGEVVDLINAYGEYDNADQPAVDCTNETNFRWRIGEDTDAFYPFLRDMWDPTCQNDPGKVSDSEYYCGEEDDGGVHSNSGVNNHAFALLVDGGTYNDTTVPAIGLTKATHLFYLAQTVYLTRYSSFADQADALEAAATQLQAAETPLPALTVDGTGMSSGLTFDAGDVNAVTAVITAVELRQAPDCPDRAALFSVLAPPPCTPYTFEALFSEDFETLPADWTTVELPQNMISWDSRNWTHTDQLPHGRAGSAFFGPTPYTAGNCAGDLDNGIIRLISPAVLLPPGSAGSLKLVFDHVVSLETGQDGGILLFSKDGGTSWTELPESAFEFNGYTGSLNSFKDNPYDGKMAFTGADEAAYTSAWARTIVDLSDLGLQDGDAVQIAWDLATDACGGWSGWWIDNVRIGRCTATALPVEWISFSAFAEDRHIALRWSTAREIDNAGFWVERLQEDGRTATNWETLGWVPAAGTGEIRTDYTFTDRTALAGVWYYYRLRQVDIDGTTTLSPITKARREPGADAWRIFPNPVRGDYLEIRNTDRSAADLPVIIYDLTGRVLIRRTVSGSRVDVRALPPGVYLLAVNPPSGPLLFRRFVR